MTSPVIHRPEHVDEVIETLGRYDDDAILIAGGTAVTLMLQQRLIAPRALVALADVPDLDGVSLTDGTLRLGARVSHSRVARDPSVHANVPVVAETFAMVGNAQVRAAATVGGVLAEADFASDPPACLLALDAIVDVRGANGQRSLGVGELINGFYETSLEPHEIITAVRVPAPSPTAAAVYLKYSSRSHDDRPCVGVAAAAELTSEGACLDLRVAVGGATETPFRRLDLEADARGRVLQEQDTDELAAAYADGIETVSDIRGSSWYRQRMVHVWVKRAIRAAMANAQRKHIAGSKHITGTNTHPSKE